MFLSRKLSFSKIILFSLLSAICGHILLGAAYFYFSYSPAGVNDISIFADPVTYALIRTLLPCVLFIIWFAFAFRAAQDNSDKDKLYFGICGLLLTSFFIWLPIILTPFL